MFINLYFVLHQSNFVTSELIFKLYRGGGDHSGVRIAFGDLSVDPETANRQEVIGTFYIMHPEYFTPDISAGHDIALIRFETPVKYTDHVRPICISASTDESNDYQQCRIAGWGAANGMYTL